MFLGHALLRDKLLRHLACGAGIETAESSNLRAAKWQALETNQPGLRSAEQPRRQQGSTAMPCYADSSLHRGSGLISLSASSILPAMPHLPTCSCDLASLPFLAWRTDTPSEKRWFRV